MPKVKTLVAVMLLSTTAFLFFAPYGGAGVAGTRAEAVHTARAHEELPR